VTLAERLAYSHINLSPLDWNSQTPDDCKKLGLHPWCLHTTARVIAERELWNFADANPDIDVTSSTFISLTLFLYHHDRVFLRASPPRIPVWAVWPRTGG